MRVKSEARRQAILDVAAEVFREHGFEQTSMAEISARLGGSKAMLYSYFPSKEALFLEVVHRFAESFMRGLFSELDPAADVSASLHSFGECFVEFIGDPKMILVLRVMYAEAGRTGAGREFYERGQCEGVGQLAGYLAQCIALGKLRPCQAQVAAQHLLAMLMAETVSPLLAGADAAALPPTVDAVARAVEAFLRAYAPD